MSACCVATPASAFDSDGLNFELIDASTCRVAVSPDATGNVVIPETVDYDDATYTVVAIGERAFADCLGIETVQLPPTVTAIGEKAFLGCRSMKVFEIGDNVTTVGDEAFRSCTSMTNVRLGARVEQTGKRLFMGCTAITAAEMPNGVSTVPDGCFYGCSALVDVTFPETLTAIGEEAFAGCTSLTRASLPASLQSAGRKAFYDCAGIKTLVLGAALTNIGTQCFDGCEAVGNVISYAAKPPVAGMYAFDDAVYSTASLTVPVGSVATYRNTFPYQEFSSIIGDDNPENHISLTMRFPQKGAIATTESFGSRVTFRIEAEEGWSVASVSFNGDDCSGDVSESGYFTTPQLFSDSELDIVFENAGGVGGETADGIGMTVHRDIIRITGAGETDTVRIFDISDGRLLREGTAKTFTFSRRGAFLLTVAGKTFKFAM